VLDVPESALATKRSSGQAAPRIGRTFGLWPYAAPSADRW
jgi:hypothetical protein